MKHMGYVACLKKPRNDNHAMKISKNSYFKLSFLISAIWNWMISIVFFFFADNIFIMLGMEKTNYLVIVQLFMCLVFAFGVGYFLVYKGVEARALIISAILGKIFVFLILFYYCFIARSLPMVLVAPGLVDLIFALLFIQVLVRK